MKWLLELAPGFYLDGQLLIIDSYGDAMTILRDAHRFRQWDGRVLARRGETSSVDFLADVPLTRRYPEIEEPPFAFAHTPIFLDPPEHYRMKNLVISSWQAAASARSLRSQVRALAHSLLSSVHASAVDFMTEVALPVSCSTLAWFFGDDPSRWVRLTREHPALWGGRKSLEELGEPLFEFQKDTWNLVASHRSSQRAGAAGRMLRMTDVAGQRLTDAQIQTIILQTVFLPNNLTIRLLGEVAARMLSDTELRDSLMEGRVGPGAVVDHILRIRPPLQRLFRRTVTPCELRGETVPANCGISVGLSATGGRAGLSGPPHNRARRSGSEPAHHLAFGLGPHFCPGAALAVMAAEVVAEELCQAPELRVGSGGCVRDADGFLCGPRTLWIERGRVR